MATNTTYNLGRVGLNIRGQYASNINYQKLDVVHYNGSSYVAKTDIPAGVLPTDTNSWMMMAQGENTITEAEPSVYALGRSCTGRKWIDGKPVYRQVIERTNIPTGGRADFHLREIAIADVISVYGIAVSSSDEVIPLPFVHHNSAANAQELLLLSPQSEPYIRLRLGSASPALKIARVIVEYTSPFDNLIAGGGSATLVGLTFAQRADGGTQITGTCTESPGNLVFFSVLHALFLNGKYRLHFGNSEALGENLRLALRRDLYSSVAYLDANSINAFVDFEVENDRSDMWYIVVRGGVTYNVAVYPLLERI